MCLCVTYFLFFVFSSAEVAEGVLAEHPLVDDRLHWFEVSPRKRVKGTSLFSVKSSSVTTNNVAVNRPFESPLWKNSFGDRPLLTVKPSSRTSKDVAELQALAVAASSADMTRDNIGNTEALSVASSRNTSRHSNGNPVSSDVSLSSQPFLDNTHDPNDSFVTAPYETSTGGLETPVVRSSRSTAQDATGDLVTSDVSSSREPFLDNTHDPNTSFVTSLYEKTSIGGLKPPVVRSSRNTAQDATGNLVSPVASLSSESFLDNTHDSNTSSVASLYENTSIGGLEPLLVTSQEPSVVTSHEPFEKTFPPAVTSLYETSMGGLQPPVVSTPTGDRLRLTPDFLVDCLHRGAEVALPALNGDFFLDFDQVQLEDDLDTDSTCTLILTGSPGEALLMEFAEAFGIVDGNLTIGVSQAPVHHVSPPAYKNVLSFSIPDNWDRLVITRPDFKVWLFLSQVERWNKQARNVNLGLNFTWVPQSTLPGMETAIVNRTLGYVQTPHFDYFTKSFFTSANQWGQMHIPVGFISMVSFAYEDSCLSFSSSGITFSVPPWSESVRACSLTYPIVLQTRTIAIQRDAGIMGRGLPKGTKGFKLWFTFHEEGTPLPRQMPDGKWNCSRDDWSSFQLHFPCNMHTDCLNGLDEETCPYTSALCAPGEFMANNKCYLFIQRDGINSKSWNTADVDCRRRGGRLVSLNTAEEWQAVGDVIQTSAADSSSDIFIGLHSAPKTLPQISFQ